MTYTTDDNIAATPTVRVVFDGPPFAGKTTAARALSEALGGTVVTPDEDDGRTLWFDWMAYEAGHNAGQPVRVELVTVPGQQDLSDRRRHLLAWGDVVVFVANTSEAVFSDSIAAFRDLRGQLLQRPETPVVVIANKRDLMDAVPMPDVVEQLGLAPSDTIIEGIALQGGGIREAFVHAVHAALEHPTRRLDATTAEALLDELQSAVAPERPASDAKAPEVPAADTPASAPEPALPTGLLLGLQRPELNPAGIADGDAIVILAEHWRVLVDVANGSGPLPRTEDPAEAVIVAELAAWGLLVDAEPVTPPKSVVAEDRPEPSPVASTPAVAAPAPAPAPAPTPEPTQLPRTVPASLPALTAAPAPLALEAGSQGWMSADADTASVVRF